MRQAGAVLQPRQILFRRHQREPIAFGVGDHIEVEGWRFEVVDLDGRRIDKLLAVRTGDSSPASP
jgi:CBS domain containing-hemolysin-like protein